jgi:hypothetical protein
MLLMVLILSKEAIATHHEALDLTLGEDCPTELPDENTWLFSQGCLERSDFYICNVDFNRQMASVNRKCHFHLRGGGAFLRSGNRWEPGKGGGGNCNYFFNDWNYDYRYTPSFG